MPGFERKGAWRAHQPLLPGGQQAIFIELFGVCVRPYESNFDLGLLQQRLHRRLQMLGRDLGEEGLGHLPLLLLVQHRHLKADGIGQLLKQITAVVARLAQRLLLQARQQGRLDGIQLSLAHPLARQTFKLSGKALQRCAIVGIKRVQNRQMLNSRRRQYRALIAELRLGKQLFIHHQAKTTVQYRQPEPVEQIPPLAVDAIERCGQGLLQHELDETLRLLGIQHSLQLHLGSGGIEAAPVGGDFAVALRHRPEEVLDMLPSVFDIELTGHHQHHILRLIPVLIILLGQGHRRSADHLWQAYGIALGQLAALITQLLQGAVNPLS